MPLTKTSDSDDDSPTVEEADNVHQSDVNHSILSAQPEEGITSAEIVEGYKAQADLDALRTVCKVKEDVFK